MANVSRTLDQLPQRSTLESGDVLHVRHNGTDSKLLGSAILGPIQTLADIVSNLASPTSIANGGGSVEIDGDGEIVYDASTIHTFEVGGEEVLTIQDGKLSVSGVMKVGGGSDLAPGAGQEIVIAPLSGGNAGIVFQHNGLATNFIRSFGNSRVSIGSVSTEYLTVKMDNGRVGIGTTTPMTALQVNGDITVYNSTDGVFSPKIVASGDRALQVNIAGQGAYIFTQSSLRPNAPFGPALGSSSSPWSGLWAGTGLFTGNVGIGANPSYNSQLYVNAKIHAQGGLSVNGSHDLNFGGNNYFAILDTYGSAARLRGYNSNGGIATAILLNPDGGNVGIGTSTPSEKLSVVGNISATGTVSATTFIPASGTLELEGLAKPALILRSTSGQAPHTLRFEDNAGTETAYISGQTGNAVFTSLTSSYFQLNGPLDVSGNIGGRINVILPGGQGTGGICLELPVITAFGTVAANSVRFGAKDVSSSAEFFVKNEAGLETQLSGNAIFPGIVTATAFIGDGSGLTGISGGGGGSFDPASPGEIGGTTPNIATFFSGGASPALTVTSNGNNFTDGAHKILSVKNYAGIEIFGVQEGGVQLGGGGIDVSAIQLTGGAGLYAYGYNPFPLINPILQWPSNVPDITLTRTASGILEQRGGTTAQGYRWNYSYTDGSNYQRASLSTQASSITLAAESAGTGADDIDINITPKGNGVVNISGDIVVTGNVTATSFIGDGSGLTGISSGGGGGSGTVNSGTSGYFGYYSSTGTTIDDQGVLYTDGTNVGIGTTTPPLKFSVVNSSSGTGLIYLQNTSASGYTAFDMSDSSGVYAGGFGYANPSTSALADSIFLSSASKNIVFTKDAGVTSSLVVNGSTGNIGIGTTSPSQKFTVVGSNANGKDQFTVDTAIGNGDGIYTVFGPYSAALGGDRSSQINITANASDGAAKFRVGIISPGTGPVMEVGVLGSGFGLSFANTGYMTTLGAYDIVLAPNVIECLRVTSGGNVGIGKANPSFKLDIQANSNSFDGFRITNSINSSTAQIQNRLENSSGGVAYYGITSSSFSGYVPINGGRAFYGSNGVDTSIFTQTDNHIIFSTNGTENMRIQSGGNVGIGTTTPSEKLTVAGNISATGILKGTGLTTSGGIDPLHLTGAGGITFGTNTATLANIGDQGITIYNYAALLWQYSSTVLTSTYIGATGGSPGMLKIDGYTGSLLELSVVTSLGTPAANCIRFGAKDVSGSAELFAINEAGDETQLTGVTITGSGTETINGSVSKSADFTVNVSDKGKMFDVSTTGTDYVTATLPSASTAGNGWWVWFRKADNARQLYIPAVSSFLTYENQTMLVWSDGTNWRSNSIGNTQLSSVSAVSNSLYGSAYIGIAINSYGDPYITATGGIGVLFGYGGNTISPLQGHGYTHLGAANRAWGNYFSTGFMEFAESSIGTPTANTARIGAKDVEGVTHLFGVDSSGEETQLTGVTGGGSSLPSGYFPVNAFQMANNATTDIEHDLYIGVGACRSENDDYDIVLSTALSKQMDVTFAEGNDVGGFAAGESMPSDGTIHIWAIVKADGTTDIFANNHTTSGLSPTLPTGFVAKRRIGSLRTISSAINPFVQQGREFHVAIGLYSVYGPIGPGSTTLACGTPEGIYVIGYYSSLAGNGNCSLFSDRTTPALGNPSSPSNNYAGRAYNRICVSGSVGISITLDSSSLFWLSLTSYTD